MRNRMGIVFLTLVVSLGALVINAAPQRAQQEGQPDAKNMNRSIPWAYGFATPYVAAPAPGGGGGAGRAAAAPAPAAAPAAPAAEPEDRDTPHHLPGTNVTLAIKEIDNRS